MIVCTKFHGNPSKSCWDISVWTKWWSTDPAKQRCFIFTHWLASQDKCLIWRYGLVQCERKEIQREYKLSTCAKSVFWTHPGTRLTTAAWDKAWFPLSPSEPIASPSPQWLHVSLWYFHSVVLEEPVLWLVARLAWACLHNFLSQGLVPSWCLALRLSLC